jgi:hypothetical protein
MGQNLPAKQGTPRLPELVRLWYINLPKPARITVSLLGLTGLGGGASFFYSQFVQARPPMGLGYSRLMLVGLGIMAFLAFWLVSGQIFKSRIGPALGSLLGAIVISVSLDFLAPKPNAVKPVLDIYNITLQPIDFNKPVRFLRYAKDVGADGAFESVYEISTTDHFVTPEHRNEVETYLFMLAKNKVGVLSAPATDIHEGEDLTFIWELDPITSQQVLTKYNSSGVLYLTAIIWYVGRPDLRPIEICKYWTRDSLDSPKSCHAHDDVRMHG